MSWAAILRKSAEYARRSLEEITSALKSPNAPSGHSPTPNYEPAYNHRRGQARPFQSPYRHFGQTRQFSSCGNECAPFFRSNFRTVPMMHFKSSTSRIQCYRRPYFRNRLNYSFRRGINLTFQSTMCCRFSQNLISWVSGFVHSFWSPINPLTAVLHRQLPSVAYALRNSSFDHHCLPSLNTLSVLRIAHQNRPYDLLKTSFESHSQIPQKVSDALDQNRTKLSLMPAYISVNAASSYFGIRDECQLQSMAFSLSELVESPFRQAPVNEEYLDGSLRCEDQNFLSNGENAFTAESFDQQNSEHPSSEPLLSAAVDFNLLHKLSLPSVSELTDSTLISIRDAIRSQIENLQAVIADISRISELGELPVSIERNGLTIRIHFPNSDAERLSTLIDDKEVTRGQIVEIPNPIRVSDPLDNAETISNLSSGILSDNTSESNFDEIWTDIVFNTPELTMNDSSASNESPETLATVA